METIITNDEHPNTLALSGEQTDDKESVAINNDEIKKDTETAFDVFLNTDKVGVRSKSFVGEITRHSIKNAFIITGLLYHASTTLSTHGGRAFSAASRKIHKEFSGPRDSTRRSFYRARRDTFRWIKNLPKATLSGISNGAKFTHKKLSGPKNSIRRKLYHARQPIINAIRDHGIDVLNGEYGKKKAVKETVSNLINSDHSKADELKVDTAILEETFSCETNLRLNKGFNFTSALVLLSGPLGGFVGYGLTGSKISLGIGAKYSAQNAIPIKYKALSIWKDLTGTKEERAAFRIESAVKSVMKKAHDLGYNVPDEYKPKKGKLGKIKSFTSRKMDETTSYAQKQLKKLQDHVGYEPGERKLGPLTIKW